MENLKVEIENIWNNQDLLKEADAQATIREVIELIDQGKLRTAQLDGDTLNQQLRF